MSEIEGTLREEWREQCTATLGEAYSVASSQAEADEPGKGEGGGACCARLQQHAINAKECAAERAVQVGHARRAHCVATRTSASEQDTRIRRRATHERTQLHAHRRAHASVRARTLNHGARARAHADGDERAGHACTRAGRRRSRRA
eukprot:6184990-Pleurochrysis_carterae.AAC.1